MNIKKLLSILVSVVFPLGMWSADGDVFEVSGNDGYTYRCYILSETERTVQLGAFQVGSSNAIVKRPSNSYMASLTIPESFWHAGKNYTVTNIGVAAFQQEFWLKKVVIPETVTEIGSDAFYRCTYLEEANIPKHVKRINSLSFYYTYLKSIDIPDGVDSIGRGAFMGTCIDSICIPASVKYIFHSNSAVEGGNSFESIIGTNWIEVDRENTVYDSRDNCCAIIETVAGMLIKGCCNTKIPNGIKQIGKRAFDYAFYSQDRKNGYSWVTLGPGAYTLELPRSVEEVGDEAFYECNELRKVSLPGRLRKIGSRAFYGCCSLDSIVSYIKEPFEVDSMNFKYWSNGQQKELSTSPILFVPIGTSELYRKTKGWDAIENIVEMDLQEPKRCATPTISYIGGVLKFECETEGVSFVSEVKNTEGKKAYENEVALEPQVTTITVFATKEGCDDSEVATATIRWRNGRPAMEGFIRVELEPDGSVGDVNGDGTVGIGDIVAITNIMAGQE